MIDTYFQRVLTDLPYVGYSLYQMFCIFCFWSVVGWVIEVVDMLIETRQLQNRGFLHIPFCPIYGVGMLLMNILFKDMRDNYVGLFLGSMVICTFVELLVGTGLEKAFNARWWDYSHMRFNFRGLICLRNTLLFGISGILMIHIIEPRLETAIDSVMINVGLIFMLGFTAVLFADTLLSLIRAVRLKRGRDGFEPILIFRSHR